MSTDHPDQETQDKTRLAYLRTERTRLAVQVTKVYQEIRDLEIKLADFHVGDVVRDPRSGKEYRIAEVHPYHSYLDYKVNPRRTNGQWSKSVQNLYGATDYVLVSRAGEGT